MTFVKDAGYVYENRDEKMVNAYEENTLTVGGVPHCQKKEDGPQAEGRGAITNHFYISWDLLDFCHVPVPGHMWSRVHRIFFYSIFIWLTLFSLYFLILRTIYFLTFFDLRPPSFAKFNFCLLMGNRRNFNGKIIRFRILCRNMV